VPPVAEAAPVAAEVAPAAAEAVPAAAEAAPAAVPAAEPTAFEKDVTAYFDNVAATGPLAGKPGPGHNAFIMICAALVLFMTLPGLALFYGGLVRSKNVLSIFVQCFALAGVMSLLWVLYGYTAAFTGGNPFIGGLDKLFLKGITPDSVAATFSKGVVIPELSFVAFQATFAAITCCLIVGSFAERIKFSAVLLFCAIWFTFSYLPIAHMVWYWDGPDAITDEKTLETVTAAAGWLWAKGALDFAGGTVVHINAGIAGLVGAYVIGKRVGYGKEAMAPHSLTLTMVGAALLWVGWFGFNAGSALEANGFAALAFINTFGATAAAVLAWCLGEALMRGKASMLGAASGAVAGLVAITPAAGNVGIGGALIIGFLSGFAGLWGVNGLKKLLGADDSLDVFGVHGVCGILGAILTGVFNSPNLGGPSLVADWTTVAMVAADAYTISGQVWTQTKAVLITVVWSGVVSVVAFKLVDLTIGLRVSEEDEREGLDITSHGETAYNR
jgi:Amt family ammonium transporter